MSFWQTHTRFRKEVIEPVAIAKMLPKECVSLGCSVEILGWGVLK